MKQFTACTSTCRIYLILCRSHTIDINNPFEVHREQLALELSPKKEATNASVKPPLVRNLVRSLLPAELVLACLRLQYNSIS